MTKQPTGDPVKAIGTQLDKAVENIKSPKAPMGADELSKDQRDAVAYFFVRLKMTAPAQYDSMMPDEQTERLTKREYAAYLKDFTKEQIDIGMDELHRQRQMRNENFRFLDIDRIIGLIRSGGKDPEQAMGSASYKILPRRYQLEDKAKAEERRAKGKKAIQELIKQVGK